MSRTILKVLLLIGVCLKTAISQCNSNEYVWNNGCSPCGPNCRNCNNGYGCTYCSDDEDSGCYDHGFLPESLCIGIPLGIFLIVVIAMIWKSCRRKDGHGQMAVPPTQSALRIEQQPSEWRPIEMGISQQACPICQHSIGNIFTSCRHCFHLTCLQEWIRKNKTCPICRKTVEDQCTIICGVCHTKCTEIKLQQNDRARVVNFAALYGICSSCLERGPNSTHLSYWQ